MNEKPEGRLARWSRLKRAERDHGQDFAPEQPALLAGASREASARPTEPKSPPATTAPELPPLSELNKDSDFTPFLRAGVPEGIHQEALRALWRSDPVFAFRDGLTDYDEDYTAIGMVEQVVRTAYQAGQGYLNEGAPAPEERVDEEGEAVAAVSSASSGTEARSVKTTPTDAADPSGDEASRVLQSRRQPLPSSETDADSQRLLLASLLTVSSLAVLTAASFGSNILTRKTSVRGVRTTTTAVRFKVGAPGGRHY